MINIGQPEIGRFIFVLCYGCVLTFEKSKITFENLNLIGTSGTVIIIFH